MITDLLAAESDMVIVGNSEATDDSLLTAMAERADMLITQDSSVADSCLTAVLDSNPAAILAISSNGNAGTSVNFVRSAVSLAKGESSSLANTIRQVASGPPAEPASSRGSPHQQPNQ